MFFCKQKTACERRISDWSSDVCSSDLHSHGAMLISRWRHCEECSFNKLVTIWLVVQIKQFFCGHQVSCCAHDSNLGLSKGSEGSPKLWWRRREDRKSVV